MAFSSNLQHLRKEANLSQEKLAEQLHITRQAVSKWESGQALPDADTCLKLCEVLGVSPNCLLLGEEQVPPSHKVIEENTANLEELKRQFENAKEEVKKEFPYENELKEKMLRLSEVNKELEIKDKDDEVIEDVDEQEEIENETKSKDYER